MDFNVKKAIDEFADEFRKILKIETPIKNMDDIVHKLNGRVRESEKLSEYSDGFVRKMVDEPFNFEIVISSKTNPKSRNFKIAHELGNLFLNMGFIVNEELWNAQGTSYYKRKSSIEEYVACYFEYALLMPEDEYIKAMDKFTQGDLVDTKKIAEFFEVSLYPATERGKQLGLLKWL